jgi:hypothetical protein
MTRLFLLGLLLGLPLAGAGQAGGPEPEGIATDLGRLRVFEKLRFQPSIGEYHFAVSPDESWIVAFQGVPDPSGTDSLVVDLIHVPTDRHWSASWAWALEPRPFRKHWSECPPYCFSEDSRRLYQLDRVADLSPAMSALEFRPIEPGSPDETAPRVFLGSRARDDQRAKIEAVSGGQIHRDALRFPPDQTLRGVDYEAILDIERERAAAARATLEELDEQNPRLRALREREGPSMLMKSLFVRESDRLTFKGLWPSPDRSLLAAVIGYTGSVRTGRHGALIPLDRGGLAAFPLGAYPLGEMFWSADSRRLYYYVRPSQLEPGTVHRRDIDLSALPSEIARTEVDPKLLDEPSDRELAERRLIEGFQADYAAFRQLLAQPQTLVAFRDGVGRLDNGQEIHLYGTRDTDDRAGLDAFMTTHVVGVATSFRLPAFEDFAAAGNYWPGKRSNLHRREEAAWAAPEDPRKWGKIPVLVYHDGELVNARFAPCKSCLAAYADPPP